MSEPSKSLQVVTIVPAPKQNPSCPHQVMGTKVLLSDGSELDGVTSLVLKACPTRGVWEAVITVLPREIPPVSGSAEFVEADISELKNESHRYARVAP